MDPMTLTTAAYASMPASAASNHEVKQQYVNGHFCYAYKFGILTNGLGIVRSIDFYSTEYLEAHPDIEIEKKSKSPNEDKSLADSMALIPTLNDFRARHPLIKPAFFLAMLPLIPLQSINLCLRILSFKKLLFP